MRTTDVRVRRAITAIAAGRPVVVTDDTTHGEQGYVVLAAEAATPRLLAFTVRHTSGYVRVALPGSECDRLNLPPMCHRQGDGSGAADRVAVDWYGTGTGISATDRAKTIAALAATRSDACDFRRPGHVVPVRAGDDGVLGRPGPAEAAVDLARLAGRRPAGALCEIVSREHPAAMARGAELVEFAKAHGLSMVSIDDLVAYRRRTEPQAVRSAETIIPTKVGASRVIGFRDVHPASSGGEHLVMIIGDGRCQRAHALTRPCRMPHRGRVRLDRVPVRRRTGPRADDDEGTGQRHDRVPAAIRAGARLRPVRRTPCRQRSPCRRPWHGSCVISGCIPSGFPTTRRGSALSCSGRFANTVCPSRAESRRWRLQGEKSYGAYTIGEGTHDASRPGRQGRHRDGRRRRDRPCDRSATRRRGLPCAVRGYRW